MTVRDSIQRLIIVALFGWGLVGLAWPDYCSGQTPASHPLDPAIQMARKSLLHSQHSIQDYTAILIQRTRVNDELSDYQFMEVKIRNQKQVAGKIEIPMGVYVKFLKPDSVKGREVIWVEGQNGGQLVAHESGFKNILRVSLDPSGYLAMRGQRYPLTEIGFEKLLLKLVATAEREREFGDAEVQLSRNARVGDRTCTMVQVTHPVPHANFEFYRAQVFFDDELNLPIRYASWTWPKEPGTEPTLQEEYTYTKVQVNVSLSDLDFDPDNKQYNFP